MKRKVVKGLVLGAIIGIVGITTAFATGGIKSAVFSNISVYFENKNIPLTNPAVSIVKDGENTSSMYVPVRELLEKLGYNVVWNGKNSSVRLTGKVISTFEEFYNQPFPLIAADYDEEVYVYAIGFEQTVLRYKGVSKAFDWVCVTPRLILPRINVFDYDNDGENELAISLNSASGTGLAVDALHIVKEKNEDLIDCQYMPEDYIKQISDAISYDVIKDADKLVIKISSEKSSADVDITSYANGVSAAASDIKLAYGSNIEFTPKEDGKIEFKAILGVNTETHFDPFYIAELKADVIYSNGKFALSNIQLE